MTETFKKAHGRKVVSRSSAEELGSIGDFLLAADRQSISALVLGRGRKARLVDWSHVTAFGPDAVMVSDDAAVREPASEREAMACEGKLDLVGKRALTETGNEIGKLDDILFAAENGSILGLRVGDRDVPAGSLLGFGSYAAVLSSDQDTLN